MADTVKDDLFEKLRKVDSVSLAIEESMDITDTAQLSLFVGFLDESANNIPINKVTSLLTDGAPAMVGRTAGVAARMKAVCPGLLSFHCIIHNAVLHAKNNGELAELLNKLVEVVNFLRAKSSKQHRDLRSFLEEEEEECYFDLPLHTAVRWLSMGQVLKKM